MSIPRVSLCRRARPMPACRASITSGRVPWFSIPATASSVSAESPTTFPSAAMSIALRRRPEADNQRPSLGRGWRVEKLVPDLLHGDERGGKERQLFAKTPDVNVDRARATGVAIPPHVREQDVARQHTTAVLQEIL